MARLSVLVCLLMSISMSLLANGSGVDGRMKAHKRYLSFANESVVTPDYYRVDLVYMQDWNDPGTTQGVALSEFYDRSGFGYTMINTNADAAFNGPTNDYRVTFDGTVDWVSGDIIALGDALSLTSDFTIMTIMKYTDASSTSRDFMSKANRQLGQSEWQWSTHWTPDGGSYRKGAFIIKDSGWNTLLAVEGNSTIVSDNSSAEDIGYVFALEYDYKNGPTLNHYADYDFNQIDGVLSKYDCTVYEGDINTAVQFFGLPLIIGAEIGGGGAPAKFLQANVGPILIYRRLLAPESLDMTSQWLRSVTRWP